MEFKGQHYIANFKDCECNLLDVNSLDEKITNAIIQAGAIILKKISHAFENGGYTSVYLLSESHCSLHTYPEHKSNLYRFFYMQ